MFEIASIFSVPPEAAAVISGAPGYESLTGYVLLYGAPGGTGVVAVRLWLHSWKACRPAVFLLCICTKEKAAVRSRRPLTAPDPIGACRASCTPIIWGICRFFWPQKAALPGAQCLPDAFCPVKPGGVPSLSIICRMTTVHNRRETPERELAAA